MLLLLVLLLRINLVQDSPLRWGHACYQTVMAEKEIVSVETNDGVTIHYTRTAPVSFDVQ